MLVAPKAVLGWLYNLLRVTAAHAFPKSRRLLKTDEYSSVFHFKCWEKGKYFRVLAKPNHLFSPRLGVVVSKKTFPLAIQRNLVKRMTRESFRLLQADLSGLDIIVQLHRPFYRDEKADVRQELLELLAEVRKCLSY